MISDKELAKSCRRAGFGQAYLPGDEELKLPQVKPIGRAVAQWAENNKPQVALASQGAVLEFVAGEEPGVVDACMVFGRELMRHGCGTRVLHAHTLLDDWDEVTSDLDERQYRCVLLEGMVPEHADHYTASQRSRLEYFCRQWVRRGHGLVLLNERAISKAMEYTALFRATVTRATLNQFTVA